MFDALMKNPLIVALPPVLSVVFGFLLSRVIELVPTFAAWWNKQSNEYKHAYRGWFGLVLALVLVVFGYFSQLLTVDLGSVADWLVLVAAVLISWLLFVGSAEGTYRATEANLPRKQPGWVGE